MDSPVKTPGLTTPGGIYSVWDNRPRKFHNVLLQVTLFILVMELAERLSYYGINQGLKNFMKTEIGWSNVSASALKSTWTSICYLTPLVGAYIADEKWGRYRTILVFGVWYCIGDFLVAFSAHPTATPHKSSIREIIFIIGLYVGIGIGTGAIKSNVITFGADQFDPRDDQEVKLKETYFNYFYFSINFGAIFSYGYLSYLSVNGSGLIPKEYGYFATYLICACVMLVALVSFIAGTGRYVFVAPEDKSISTLVQFLFHIPRIHPKGTLLLAGSLIMVSSIFLNVIGAFMKGPHPKWGEAFSWASAIAVVIGITAWVIVGMDTSFIDGAKVSNGGDYDDERVEGYKKLLSCLPFAAFTIIWHCAYDQTDANFQSMTQQCDLRWNTNDIHSAQVPGAMLGVFDPIVIVICIPILDSIVYPAYTRLFGKRPSQFGKASAGLLVAAIGIFWSGIFEIMRRNSGTLVGEDRIKGDETGRYILDGGSKLPMNKLYWAAAIPNYVFIALAECLVNVTAYDVFYSTVPLSLKSTAQAVNLLMSSMGASLTSTFTIMFSPYLPSDDLNKGHLEYMYFAMGVVSLLNLGSFVAVMRKMDFGTSTARDAALEAERDLLHKAQDSVSSRHSFAGTK